VTPGVRKTSDMSEVACAQSAAGGQPPPARTAAAAMITATGPFAIGSRTMTLAVPDLLADEELTPLADARRFF
jgi:hypothetical protein